MQLDNTFGAAFLGMVFAAGLHGVSCVQAVYYFTHQTDQWRTKLLVAAVMVFDTVHQALITHSIYTYMVTHYGVPEKLGLLVWSLIVEVLFNGFIAVLVQSFLTVRIWKLSGHSILLTGFTVLLVAGEFISVVAFTWLALKMDTFTELATLQSLSIVVNVLAAAGDVLIAGSLCYLLHSSRTGFQRSDSMINRLILFTVNTGLLTSLCALASLISITAAPTTFLYIPFFFCIGRLYTNSLLATLNARKMIRKSADGIHTSGDAGSYSLSNIQKQGVSGVNTSASKKPTNISIQINTTQEYAMDRDSERKVNKDQCLHE